MLDPAELGEFGLIEVLRRRTRKGGARWTAAIGDDAALLRPRPGRELVLTQDALIEDVHFRWSTTAPRELGHKLLAASLSDLGAMGAEPLGCLLSLGFPARTPSERLDGFVRGLLRFCSRSGCPLVGGDTVSAPVWTLSLTAVGDVPRGQALRRRGARPGDRLLVTGGLGAAALGLALLETGRSPLPGARRFVLRQLRPDPPWRAAAALRRLGIASAAIDISDGLAQDLAHVLRESGVGADLQLDRLPFERGMRELCERLGLSAEELALSGGEDYELLFTVRPGAPGASELARRMGCQVSEIGAIRRGRGLRLFRAGARVSAPIRGFEHFKTPSGRAEK